MNHMRFLHSLALLPFVLVVACNQSTTNTSGASLRFLTGKILPLAIAGEDYAKTLNLGDGTRPYTTRVIKGALPPGIALSGNSLRGIAGGKESKTYEFTIEANDANLSNQQQDFSLEVRVNPASSLEWTVPKTETKGDIKIPLLLRYAKPIRSLQARMELPEGTSFVRLEPGVGKPIFITKLADKILRFDAALTEPFKTNKDDKTFAYLILKSETVVKPEAWIKPTVVFKAAGKTLGETTDATPATSAPAKPGTPATPTKPTTPPAAPTTPGGKK